MARKKKAAGRPSSGPFTADDIQRALEHVGWVVESRGPHTHLTHPAKPGRKVTIARKWTGVKTGHSTFRGVAEQAGMTTTQLKQLLNEG